MRELLIPIGPGPAPGPICTISNSSVRARPSLPWAWEGATRQLEHASDWSRHAPVTRLRPYVQNPQCFAVQGHKPAGYYPPHPPWVHPWPGTPLPTPRWSSGRGQRLAHSVKTSNSGSPIYRHAYLIYKLLS